MVKFQGLNFVFVCSCIVFCGRKEQSRRGCEWWCGLDKCSAIRLGIYRGEISEELPTVLGENHSSIQTSWPELVAKEGFIDKRIYTGSREITIGRNANQLLGLRQ